MRSLGRGVPALLLLGSVSACGRPPSASLPPVETSQHILARYQGMSDRLAADAKSQLVMLQCPAPPGVRRCGLLTDELAAHHAFQYFAEETCAIDLGSATSDERVACFRGFIEHAARLFAKRYPKAQREEIEQKCLASEGNCGKLWQYELAWMNAHDDAVFATWKSGQERLTEDHREAQRRAQSERDRREREDAKWRERRARALAAIGAGLQAFGRELGRQSATTTSSESAATGTTTSSDAAPAGCASDYQCGIGQYCVKPPGRFEGKCADVVNRIGSRVYASPRSGSVGPGKRSCDFDADCGPGFRCIQGNCMK